MIKRISGILCIYLIRIYQICLSLLFGPCCRFHPTCSEYAITAIRKYGMLKGMFHATKRILHCHPFNPGGYDPVK